MKLYPLIGLYVIEHSNIIISYWKFNFVCVSQRNCDLSNILDKYSTDTVKVPTEQRLTISIYCSVITAIAVRSCCAS